MVGGPVESIRDILKIAKDSRWLILAFGLTWGWTSIVSFSALTLTSSVDVISPEMYRALSLAASILTILAIPFLSRCCMRELNWVMGFGCCLAVASSLLVTLDLFDWPAPVALSAFCAGAGSILMTYSVLGLVGRAESFFSIIAMLCLSLLVSTACFALAFLLSTPFAIALSALCPCAAWFCYCRHDAQGDRERGVGASKNDSLSKEGSSSCIGSERSDPSRENGELYRLKPRWFMVAKDFLVRYRFPWRMVAGFALFGGAYGIMASASTVQMLDPAWPFINAAVRGATGVALLCVVLVSIERQWTMMLLGAGSWVVAFFSSYAIQHCGALFTMAWGAVGYTCFEMLMFAVIFEIAANTRLGYMLPFCVCSASMLGATLFGSVLGRFAEAAPIVAPDVLVQWSIFAALVGGLLLFDVRRVSGLWGLELTTVEVPPAKDEEMASLLMSRYSLTPRECEVTTFLSKGRNEPYISETLFLSRATVHTHVRAIYQKLGVHSRQELLNLLEDLLSTESDIGPES